MHMHVDTCTYSYIAIYSYMSIHIHAHVYISKFKWQSRVLAKHSMPNNTPYSDIPYGVLIYDTYITIAIAMYIIVRYYNYIYS